MTEAMYTLLTDANTRTDDAVDASLDNELSAGAFWFD